MRFQFRVFVIILFLAAAGSLHAGVGDPQIRTDHPWYPGELACSTFERLFKTQAEVYERVVGRKPVSDEDKALAAWLWRNTHYYHGEEGAQDLWGQGFTKGFDQRTREYWTGLFAHGFGLCGTTHAQWSAEMEALLGHNRGRCVGVSGHNSFEVFLTGGAYGEGKWAMLDHDTSTIIYDAKGSALLSIGEIQRDWKNLAKRTADLKKQHGWQICGLHPDDGGSYATYSVAEYLPGYSGPPPMVHLRRGETLRRYPQPGLDDGKTFVFWGRNYNTASIPGPERAHTWVNQPAKMYQSKNGAGFKPGALSLLGASRRENRAERVGDRMDLCDRLADGVGCQVQVQYQTRPKTRRRLQTICPLRDYPGLVVDPFHGAACVPTVKVIQDSVLPTFIRHHECLVHLRERCQ